MSGLATHSFHPADNAICYRHVSIGTDTCLLLIWTNAHLEVRAEFGLCVAVHLGDLDVGEAGEVLVGQVVPDGGESLAVAAPAFQGKDGGGAS